MQLIIGPDSERMHKASYIMTWRHGEDNARRDNLFAVLEWLSRYPMFAPIVVEQDSAPCLSGPLPHADVTHVFAFNAGPFNKSWGLNVGFRASSLPWLAFADADVIAGDALPESLGYLAQGYAAVKPYRRLIDLDETESVRVRSGDFDWLPLRDDGFAPNRENIGEHIVFAGGAFLITRAAFAAAGAWDERFLGWGGEDDAMSYKMERLRLPAVELDRPTGAASVSSAPGLGDGTAAALRLQLRAARRLPAARGRAACAFRRGADADRGIPREIPADMTAVAPSNLLIGTPAYGGMVHSDFASALLTYQQQQIRFALMTIGNESLITRARNTILSEFHARPEFTHLLFLDADVLLPAAGLSRMLESGRDVIGAAVALKGRTADGSRIFNVGKLMGEDGAHYRVERIGTAALLLSRKAVDALVDEARGDGRIYRRNHNLRGMATRAEVHFDVFRTGVVDDEYLSEDFWVCRQLRAFGFAIHLDPTIVTRHSGMMEA